MTLFILGAGLAGCLAGALAREAQLLEAGPEVSAQHKAVLRFRDDKISRALGIPFTPVRVLKSLWSGGEHKNWCSPRDLNQYSQKVIGRYEPRSIVNLDAVTRFVAPENLHERLAEQCLGRIRWDTPVTTITPEKLNDIPRLNAPVVSTIPITALATACGVQTPDAFEFQPILVERWRVFGCAQHQTVYFPEPQHGMYRATLTGALFTVESVRPLKEEDLETLLRAFALERHHCEYLGTASQRYGKILPLPATRRKELLLNFTVKFNVYSLGRFACWRNVLLDDVYEDFFKVRNMINLGQYDLMKAVI